MESISVSLAQAQTLSKQTASPDVAIEPPEVPTSSATAATAQLHAAIPSVDDVMRSLLFFRQFNAFVSSKIQGVERGESLDYEYILGNDFDRLKEFVRDPSAIDKALKTLPSWEKGIKDQVTNGLEVQLRKKWQAINDAHDQRCAKKIKEFLTGIVRFYSQMQALFPNLTEPRFKQLWEDLFQPTIIELTKARPYESKDKKKVRGSEMYPLTKHTFGRDTLDAFSEELFKIALDEESNVAKEFVRQFRAAVKLDPIDELKLTIISSNSSKTSAHG